MAASVFLPKRYHDRFGKPFLLDRHARIGIKGKAVEYGIREEIVPVKPTYTLADQPVFDTVLEALVANAGARRLVRDAYRSARADGALDVERAQYLMTEVVATMRAISPEQAGVIVQARLERALRPGEGASKGSRRPGGRDGSAAHRKTSVRRLHRHRRGG